MSEASPNMLSRLKSRLVRMAGPLGMYAFARAVTRSEPRILMYHRFRDREVNNGVPIDVFRAQVRLLKRKFNVVPLSELAQRIENGAAGPDLAVITVDDGYRDFFDVAYPILREEGLVATFFVTTGFIDRSTWLWPDVLKYIREHWSAGPSELTEWLADSGLRAGGAAAATDHWSILGRSILDMPTHRRTETLNRLADLGGVVVPSEPVKDYEPCTWDQLRELSAAGFEIGAHTVTHPRLTRLEDKDLVHEVDGSKKRLEDELGQQVVSFCYPNGAVDDYDDTVVAVVRSAGYSVAVTAHCDGVPRDKYRLRRLGVDEDMFQFRKAVFGVEHVKRMLPAQNSVLFQNG